MSDKIAILSKHFKEEYFIIDEEEPGTIVVHPREKDFLECLKLKFEGDTMKVDYLSKCSYRLSGSQTLGIVNKFAKESGLTTVKLKDKSDLPGICYNYPIPLYILYILSTGKSWYNSYGYVSKTYASEIDHNRRLLNMRFSDFIKLCNSKRRAEWGRESEEELDESINGFIDVMNKSIYYRDKKNSSRTRLNLSMKVQEIFTRIKKYLLKNMPPDNTSDNIYCFMLKWLFELIHISGVIKYDFRLSWNVTRPYSGKKSSRKFNSSVRKRNTTETKNKNPISRKRSSTFKRYSY